jgi:hypothetical protein
MQNIEPIIFEYSIEKNDFLTFQLYTASKSERLIKKRKNSKNHVPIIYLVCSILFLLVAKYILASVFFVIGILWFFIYPIWEKTYYYNHYKSFEEDRDKTRRDGTCKIEINEGFIFSKSDDNESKFSTKGIISISELSNLILINFTGGQSIIIPKDKISIPKASVILFFKELANSLKVPYTDDNNWIW